MLAKARERGPRCGGGRPQRVCWRGCGQLAYLRADQGALCDDAEDADELAQAGAVKVARGYLVLAKVALEADMDRVVVREQLGKRAIPAALDEVTQGLLEGWQALSWGGQEALQQTAVKLAQVVLCYHEPPGNQLGILAIVWVHVEAGQGLAIVP